MGKKDKQGCNNRSFRMKLYDWTKANRSRAFTVVSNEPDPATIMEMAKTKVLADLTAVAEKDEWLPEWRELIPGCMASVLSFSISPKPSKQKAKEPVRYRVRVSLPTGYRTPLKLISARSSSTPQTDELVSPCDVVASAAQLTAATAAQ
ncbi:hypothetical protein JXA59_00040 [Patescibacteria group bacterium]|nr:hypothetical protein [Patescibacteria group bacterium]